MTVEFTLNGRPVSVARDGASLLSALREDLGAHEVKDGCSPQGQCGCCTVLVDGAPRVACVTPLRRVAGRSVVTVEGLEPGIRERLVGAFAGQGASQCGFCTPGILCRLAAIGPEPDRASVESALLAHLCRCTGWRTVVDAACDAVADRAPVTGPRTASICTANADAAAERAELEGRAPQRVGNQVILGGGGFADDTAPAGCLVAVPDGAGGWAVGESLDEARAASGKVQGRRSGQPVLHPVELPPGSWDLTLQTTWVEPAYLEPDASWCLPGGEPASPMANGGAFGGKTDSLAPTAAKMLAERYGRPVRVVYSREDVVRLGAKRPPLSAGIRLDGTGVIRLAAGAGAGATAAIAAVAPGLSIEEVPVPGPPVSSTIRAAGWAEAAVLIAGAAALRDRAVVSPGKEAPGSGTASVRSPGGGSATAAVNLHPEGWPAEVQVTVACGPSLDEVTLRSYVTGAAHMALGWVCSEAIAVGEDGVPDDLTIRSFGVLRARDTPPIKVTVDPWDEQGIPVNGSDAAFAAVAAATWIAQGLPARWPTLRERTP